MKLLILGGTMFLGRWVATDALSRGHEVTLFNRGRREIPELAGVETLRGDRDRAEDLEILRRRRWDAVVDTCGYFPRQVRASAQLLADSVDSYIFVSSISVYANPLAPRSDESADVGTTSDLDATQITGENYGPLKALCEQAAEAALPGRAMQVRSGLIVGPHDPTDRFTYWVRRAADGGEILAPGDGTSPVQYIDVRDLAAWIVASAERRTAGVFNATGPTPGALDFREFLGTCMDEAGTGGRFVWASEAFLESEKVEPWSGLPLWLPSADCGMSRVGTARAAAAGLVTRPLSETVRATLEWDAPRRTSGQTLRAGITREREMEVLAALRAARY